MNEYEARQEAKRERLNTAADRAENRQTAAWNRASGAVAGIPMGQPILVGHHSEKRHRAALRRSDGASRKAVEEGKRAKELRERAASVGSGGISSDDPDTVSKLRAKLERIEADRATLKKANEIYRKVGTIEAVVSYLGGSGAINDALRSSHREHKERGFGGNWKPFESWQLSNASANARSVRKRIEELEARAPADTPNKVIRSGDGWRVEERHDLNRLVIEFDGIPTKDVRADLKRHGFKWFRSEGVWSRSLSNGSAWAAGEVVNALPKARREQR